jgi:hypothetical protein
MNLPPALQLSTLLSTPGASSLGPAQERSMLMVHLLHLDAVTMLYRQLLVSVEGTLYASQSLASFSSTEIQQYRQNAQVAAIQIARVLEVLHTNKWLSPRCWLIM